MKTLNYLSFALVIFCLVCTSDLQAQVKEVPVTTSSKDALNYFLEGRDNFENIEFTEAASFFDKAILKDPDFAMAYLYRSSSGGGFNISRQNLEKAESLIMKVSEGEKLEILFAKSSADGNNLQAKEYLDQLLKLYPDDKRVQMFAGSYYYSINDFKNSLVHLTTATELDKNYAPSYNLIGYCYSAMNNYQEAEKAFQTYIRLIPEKANPYDSYGEMLLNMGKYDESIAQYKKAIEKNPSFTSSLLGISNNYIFKGDYQSARKYIQEFFNKASNVSDKLVAQYNKALSYIYEGKIHDAMVAFEEYRTMSEKENLTTNCIMSFAYQGYMLSEDGKPLEGTTYYEKAIDLIGKSNLPETIKENFLTESMLWRFYFLIVNSDLSNAETEAVKCKTRVESRRNIGEEMMLNGLLGLLEIKKGNYDKAITYLLNSDGQDPWTWYYTGIAYSKKGEMENANKFFKKVTSCNISSLDLAVVRNRAFEELKK